MTAIGWCELTYVFVQPGSAVNTAFERAEIRKTTQRSADIVLIIKYVSTEHNLCNNVFTYKKHDDIIQLMCRTRTWHSRRKRLYAG